MEAWLGLHLGVFILHDRRVCVATWRATKNQKTLPPRRRATCATKKIRGIAPPKAKLATVDEGYQEIFLRFSQYIPGFVERDNFVVLLMGSFPEALNIRGVWLPRSCHAQNLFRCRNAPECYCSDSIYSVCGQTARDYIHIFVFICHFLSVCGAHIVSTLDSARFVLKGMVAYWYDSLMCIGLYQDY